MTHLSDFHKDYWRAFQDLKQTGQSGLSKANPSNSYMIFPVGVGGAHLAASVLVRRHLLTFYLLIQGALRDELYRQLYAQKAEIEGDLRETPVWTVSNNSNRARVTVELNVDNFDNRQDWPRQHRWIFGKAQMFDKAFRQRLHDLKASR